MGSGMINRLLTSKTSGAEPREERGDLKRLEIETGDVPNFISCR